MLLLSCYSSSLTLDFLMTIVVRVLVFFLTILFCIFSNSAFSNQVQNRNDSIRELNQKAFQFWGDGKLEESIHTFKNLQQLNEQAGNINGARQIDTQLGLIYSEMGDYESSVTYFKKALVYKESKGNKAELVSAYTNLAIVYRTMEDYEDSNLFADKGLVVAKELGQKDQLKTLYGILAENYQSLGQSEKAFEYFNTYTTLEKSLSQEENAQREKELQAAKSKSEKIEKALEQKNEQLDQIEEQAIQQKTEIEQLSEEKQIQEKALQEKEESLKLANRITLLLIVIGLLVVVFSIVQILNTKKQKKYAALLETRNEKIENINREIRTKNRNITASINYAKRIQEAMLPSIDQIREHLPESFVLFKPKDLVSGDFYWFKHIDGYKTEFAEIKPNSIISAIDCTGHGVPGAFMSMMGNEILNRIVVSHGITTADGILNNLHKEITEALQQDKTDSKDGMDLGLCVYSQEQNLLSFSGAKNPLVYIQNEELHTIKGDKMPIGGAQLKMDRRFSKHQLIIEEPTYCYLYSDGFQDQFGGPEGRKFMVKRLKNLLLEIHKKPMPEQKDLLEQKFEEWRGDNQQIDDVLVIGFKLYPSK